MRAALWLLALFGVAVAIALFAGNNQGTVTLFWPPYRIDLSLNLVLLLLVGGFVVRDVGIHYAAEASIRTSIEDRLSTLDQATCEAGLDPRVSRERRAQGWFCQPLNRLTGQGHRPAAARTPAQAPHHAWLGHRPIEVSFQSCAGQLYLHRGAQAKL